MYNQLRANICVFATDSKPTLKELQAHGLLDSEEFDSIVVCIAAKWKRVAIALSIKQCHIDIIEADTRGVVEACLKMLQWWLEKEKRATWHVLINAIRDLEELNVLAHNIERVLSQTCEGHQCHH